MGVRGRIGPSGPLVAVVLAATLLGTAGTAAQLGPDDIGPLTAGSWRTATGALGLAFAACARGQAPWRYRWRSRWSLVGALALGVNQLAFFAAIEAAGVATGTLVTIATLPIASGAIDWGWGRRPDRGWLAGVAISLTGVALLTGGSAEPSLVGVAWGVLAGAAGSIMALAIQRLGEDRPALPATTTVVAGGALVLAPVALVGAPEALSSLGALLTVTYLGLATMALAYVLFAVGLRRLPLSTVTAVGLLEPAVAAALAVVVLSEPLRPAQLLGMASVLAGVAASWLDSTRRPAIAPPAQVVAE